MNEKCLRAALSLLALLLSAGLVRAQTPSGASLLKEFEAKETKALAAQAPSSDAAKTRSDKLLSAEADYDIFVYQNRRENLEWQLKVSRWIFWIVVAIVVSGLCLSIWQFSRPLHPPAPSSDPAAADPATTFEASTSGIKISSPILGVIILALSMVFFYLYVVKVYPIVEIAHPSGAEASQPAK